MDCSKDIEDLVKLCVELVRTQDQYAKFPELQDKVCTKAVENIRKALQVIREIERT